MLDDIRPPGLKSFKRPKKPKPEKEPKKHLHEHVPDFVIDENGTDEKPAKQRKVLIAPHKHFVRFWRWWTGLNRNIRFGLIAALLLVFAAGSVFWYEFIQPKSDVSVTIDKHAAKPPPPPTTVASPLTGVQVDPAAAARPVTGVMIENSVFARPQSGLQDAGVVVEAIAEGGITRFMALFQDSRPQHIGPVRSLRPYYLDFGAAFQASIAHVGGSPEALSRVRNGNYRDIDQFFNANSYHRVSYRDAPHNVYTSFDDLDALNKSKGYTTSTYETWPRKTDKKLATPTAKSINVQISSPDYYSHYDYDAASNTYTRNEAGAPHLELTSDGDKTGVLIRPKVVIALVMAYSIASDGQHSQYNDVGAGTAYVFQDGGVTKGQWHRPSAESQVQFTDADGAPLKLDAGQTWMTLVADTGKVSYTP